MSNFMRSCQNSKTKIETEPEPEVERKMANFMAQYQRELSGGNSQSIVRCNSKM